MEEKNKNQEICYTEFNALKMQVSNYEKQNILYKDLVDELKSKNNILQEYNKVLKDKTYCNDNVFPTYAQKFTSNNVKKRNVPKILLNFKDNNNAHSSLNEIKQTITRNSNVPLDYINNTNDGKVIIQCHNDSDINKIKNLLESKAEDKYELSLQKFLNPLIKILEIDDEYKDMEMLLSEIVKRNHLSDKDIKVRHLYTPKNQHYFNAIIEVSKETYAILMEEKKVFFGCQRYGIVDEFNINNCFKCGKFNHSKKKCKENIQKCLNCAGNHHIQQCNVDNVIK